MFVKMLSKLVPAWVWAAVLGVALVGGLGWWGMVERDRLVAERDAAQSEVETLTASRDRWHARAMDVLGQLGDERRRAREAEAALVALQARLAERDERYRALRRRIEQAPSADDGDVAPVLRDTLEALP